MTKYILSKVAEGKFATLLKTNFFTGIFQGFRLQMLEHLFVADSEKWNKNI